MQKTLFAIFLLLSTFAYSQTITQIDSMSKVMCDYLNKSTVENDTAKLIDLYKNTLVPYLTGLADSKREKVGQQAYYRLQRNCLEFRDLLVRLEPPKDEVQIISQKPVPDISKKEIKQFKKMKEFFYYEPSGERTNLTMDKGTWTDLFADDTYSRLTYKWLNKTEFELEFIESNNVTRSNFSVKGDKYQYQLLSKEEGHFKMSVTIPGQNSYEVFKLYFE